MNVARAIDGFLDALANTGLAVRSPSVLLPFFAFGAIQILLLTPIAFFAWGPIAGFMPAVVETLGGDPALHYPTHFVLLPATYRVVYLPLVATVGFALWTLGVWSMIGHHEASRRLPEHSFARALPSIVIVGVVFVAVTVAVGRGLALVAAELPPGMPTRAATLAVIAVTAIVQALLVYAPVVLRLRGGGPWGAFRASVRYATRHFGATALLIGTVLMVHLPFDALIGNADAIAGRFHPEAVYQLMIGSIVLEVVTAFVLFAGVVALAFPEEGGLR